MRECSLGIVRVYAHDNPVHLELPIRLLQAVRIGVKRQIDAGKHQWELATLMPSLQPLVNLVEYYDY